ncbi:hypothetical protein N8737_01460 [Verrucomicrobia bacterium]|jgi:hypothetical protein|nr:hypothetical protein [Verrucomicrobiota bacterium]MDA7510044.1 hypothetical protein [Verrucomicrobiota bacterium]MDA7657346.1 hypothetical protein [Verrucomicrobiota bacterium]
MKRFDNAITLLFLLLIGSIYSVQAYNIACENSLCEISDAEDIGVGWGVIQEWQRPAWEMYLSDMTNIQLGYQRCNKYASDRYSINLEDAKADFDTCSLVALTSAIGCVATCHRGLRVKLPACVRVCTVEWAAAKAFCANEWVIDRISAKSKKETDHAICQSERARARGQAARDRDQQLANRL